MRVWIPGATLLLGTVDGCSVGSGPGDNLVGLCARRALLALLAFLLVLLVVLAFLLVLLGRYKGCARASNTGATVATSAAHSTRS